MKVLALLFLLMFCAVNNVFAQTSEHYKFNNEYYSELAELESAITN